MHTELRYALVALVLLLGASRVRAADVRVDAATRIRAIALRFDGPHRRSENEVRAALAERGPGWLDGAQSALAWLPFVTRPEPRRFRPVELQRDVVRLRRGFAEAGYPRAEITYDVTLDERRNQVRVTFRVREGAPDVIQRVRFEPVAGGAALPLPAGQEAVWRQFERQVAAVHGTPLRAATMLRLERDARAWWQDRGHPFADARIETALDSLTHAAELTVRLEPGPYAVIGAVRVEGMTHVREGTIRRVLPVHRGERYSARRLAESQRAVQALPIVRLALADTPEPPASDSTIGVRVRITEAPPRLMSAELGYVSDAGVASEVRWTHYNLDHRALSFTALGLAQTGLLAISDQPEVRYRGSLTLQKPAFPTPRMSLIVSPFAEHHDDLTDRARIAGLDLTSVYQFAPLRSLAVTYQFARTRVYQRRLDDFAAGNVDLLQLFEDQAQGLLDSLGSTLRSSVVTLTGSLGTLDDPASPRRGIVLRPVVALTTPSAGNTTEYLRADATLQGYLPLRRRSTFSARATHGRVFPFGHSLPGSDAERASRYLQLRDVAFTAGGSGDVRGWANDLLGPKFPDLRVETVDGTAVLRANGYVPIGGLARSSASLELSLPLPGLSATWGTFAFLDAGRVWTPDHRFQHGFDRPGQERTFYSTGGGLEVRTPVGPIRAGFGYKLNPSLEDLVSSSDLVDALVAGRSPDDLPQRRSRRWQFHLAIGSSY
ncbi:MAG: BamA/TamA family outer membrane protein [Candidatus Eisenbacteria bacterium]